MDSAVWYRLEQVAAWLLALDWNRALGRLNLPRDIVRIVFDQTFGDQFRDYYEWRMRRCKSKLEAFEWMSHAHLSNAKIKEAAKLRHKYEYRIIRIRTVAQRYRIYSATLSEIVDDGEEGSTRLWIMFFANMINKQQLNAPRGK